MGTTPLDIIALIESWTGHRLGGEEGITFGPRTRPVSAAAVAWGADPVTIDRASKAGCDLLIHHEALTYPYPDFTLGHERHYLSWPPNTQRLSALGERGMAAMRIHGAADELSVFEAIRTQLGLGKPITTNPGAALGYATVVFASPQPTFGALIEQVKAATGMAMVRATTEPDERPCRRVGLPWGGMGLFVNLGFVQDLVDLGVDTLICGETDNYAFRFAAEQGIAVIELSHEISEAQGLRAFAERLDGALPMPVHYIETEPIWRGR